ncbi:MAG TPA: HAMP domain-containing protein [Candidatus Ozemobacteraceae bacterium]
MIRMSMATRFRFGAGFSIFIVIFLGLFSIYHLHYLNEEIQTQLTDDLTLIRFADAAGSLCNDVQYRVTAACQASSPTQLAEAVATLEKARRHLESGFLMTPARQASAAALLADLTEYAGSIQALASETILPLPERYLLVTDRHRSFLGKLETFVSTNLEVLTTRQANLAAVSKSFQTRMGVIAVLTVVLAIFMSIFFSQQISLPVRRLRDIINTIRDGNYEITVGTRGSSDEISQIFTSLSHMAEHIAIRDRLKLDKIDLEKRRFAMLSNYIGVPLILINAENKVAFANNEFLGMFKLAWDDIYEVDLGHAPLHPKLKEKINGALARREWPDNEPLNISCEAYSFDLNVSLMPVKKSNNEIASVICLLGKARRTAEKPDARPRPQQ